MKDQRLIKQAIEENYNDVNLAELDKSIEQENKQKVLVRMIDKGPAPCKVKVTEKSQEICASLVLK